MAELREHLHTFRWFMHHPHLEREDIIDFQRRKLRAILENAHAHVLFQRAALERESIDPRDIRNPTDLSAIPICRRSAFQAAPQEQRLRRGALPDNLWLNSTSGMQGIPLRIYRSPLEEHLLGLFRLRARSQFGVRLRDRCAKVVAELKNYGRVPLRRRAVHALGFLRNVEVPWRRPRDVLRDLASLSPDSFGAYSGILCCLAETADEYACGRLQPRLVTCGGETLLPSMRLTIEKAFNAPLFETYGAHECNLIAWQCPETNLYHVCDDNVILEIIKTDGRPARDGEQGEVVLTTLHSYTMPFLRYAIGDLAVRGPESCPCGQPFSTLLSIRGRMNDFFSLPDGRLIHAYELSQVFFGVHDKWVRRRQYVQRTEDQIVIRVSPVRQPSEQELQALREDFRRFLGPEINLQIDLVDELDFEPSGKFRLARSELKSHYASTGN